MVGDSSNWKGSFMGQKALKYQTDYDLGGNVYYYQLWDLLRMQYFVLSIFYLLIY